MTEHKEYSYRDLVAQLADRTKKIVDLGAEVAKRQGQLEAAARVFAATAQRLERNITKLKDQIERPCPGCGA